MLWYAAGVAPDILQRVAAEVAEVAAAYPELAAVWVFGSVARGGARPDSDLDVALLFRERGQGLREHHRAMRMLALQLEARSGRSIDLVAFESQGPILRYRILSEGVCVYEADRERRVDAESDTYPRYFDYRRTWDAAAGQSVEGMRRWLEARR